MLMPPFAYTQSTDLQEMAATLSRDVAATAFKHVFFLTTDSAWTSLEMDGEVIWLPSIPLESMDPHLRKQLLKINFDKFCHDSLKNVVGTVKFNICSQTFMLYGKHD